MGHRIRANHANQVPTRHLVFDCETRPIVHPSKENRRIHLLRLGCATSFRCDSGLFSREKSAVFRSPEEWADLVDGTCEERKGLWIWAHNLGFDLAAVRFWDLCESGRFQLFPETRSESESGRNPAQHGAFVTEDPPTILQFRTRSGVLCTAVDTLNYLQRPLSDLGRMVGLEKLSMPGWLESLEEWELYCARDTEILSRVVKEILRTTRDCDLGNLRFTSASQAWSAWRHTKPTPVVDFHQSELVKSEERQAYYGARTWLFVQGKVTDRLAPGESARPFRPGETPVHELGPIYRCDVNGHYPFAMLCHKYPSRYLRTVFDWEPERLWGCMEQLCAVAHVRIKSERGVYPVRTDRGTIFARGKFHTWLCGQELYRALRDREVVRVVKAHLYTADFILKPFAERLVRARQLAEREGNQLRAAICKATVNALHGKFAQLPGRWEYDPAICPPFNWGSWARLDYETGEIGKFRAIAGKAQRYSRSGERDESFPAIAAHVAANAREHMLYLARCAGPDGVLYEDADSLHLSRLGYEALRGILEIGQTTCGGLRLVETADTAEYRGAKDYTFGGREVVAGLCGEEIEAYPHHFRSESFLGINLHLASQPEQGPLVDQVVKARPHGRIAQSVDERGITSPLVLDL